MGKLLLRLLVVVCLLASSSARAASFQTITLEVGPTGSLVIHNETNFDLGALTILTTGATDFTFNDALPGLSPADRVFNPDTEIPPYGVLVAYHTALGVPLVPAFSQALLGSFQIPAPSSFEFFSRDDILGGTVYDRYETPLIPVSVYSHYPSCDGIPPCSGLPYNFVMTFVPEPAGGNLASLVILGLAALVSTRRIASCA